MAIGPGEGAIWTLSSPLSKASLMTAKASSSTVFAGVPCNERNRNKGRRFRFTFAITKSIARIVIAVGINTDEKVGNVAN
jgi:hypothetical protein